MHRRSPRRQAGRRVAEPRVAIAYDCFFPVDTGGGERVYRRLAELFAARGSAVDYVTRRGRDAAVDAGFDVVGIWSGDIADADGTRTPSSAMAFAAALFRYFVRHRRDYDLVLVAALPVLNVFAVRLALLGARAVVATDWLEIWPWRKWRGYAGALVGTVAFVLQSLGVRVGHIQTVNSQFTRSRLVRYRSRADPLVLGLVDLVGAATAAPGRPASPPTILFVGRHIADKQLDALPAALAVARATTPDLVAVVAGVGPETEAARRAAEAAGVVEAVHFVGRVDDAELDVLMGAAVALVNPSMREGFGLVVAEAASHGTPSVVVAGEDNAAAELVIDGENGYVAASAAPAVLGDAIARAVTGGEQLRRSTAAWFARERSERSLGQSAGEIVAKWRAITEG
jgi:glycosyltransferase involved in cell wall biosynthesis